MSELQRELRYFKVYKILPFIVAGILFTLFFVLGIIDPILGKDDLGFGLMPLLQSGFLCWLIWTLIGSVSAAASFFYLKVVYSYRILHIYYLQKVASFSETFEICDKCLDE